MNKPRLDLGKTVTAIDRKRRCVLAEGGIEAPYERLLIATGSQPFILPRALSSRRSQERASLRSTT